MKVALKYVSVSKTLPDVKQNGLKIGKELRQRLYENREWSSMQGIDRATLCLALKPSSEEGRLVAQLCSSVKLADQLHVLSLVF